MLFVDEIHRMSRPAEEMLYLAMEDFRVDVVVGKGPGRHRDPAGDPAVHAGRRDHPRRPAARAAARPVRLHRPPGVLRAPPSSSTIVQRSAGLLGVAADARRRRRDRLPLARHAAHRQPAAAPGPRLRPGAGRRRRHPRRRPRRPGPLRGRRSSASTGSTGRSSTPCAGGSAAARSGCRTLAVAVGEERETVEEVAEPFLVRDGFLARTPRGRVATRRPGSTSG